MPRKTIKSTFAGGELADALEGRVDISRYSTSFQVGQNMFTTRFGGVSNRTGTEFIATSLSDGTARLVPFEFSVTQTYVLEFTDDRLRVMKDGSIVLTSRREATHRWIVSGSGTSEYYYELAAGGDPSVPGALEVWAGGVQLTQGTIGALSASSWAFGDNDTLGFSTIYVRLADSADPDSKAVGFVQSDYQVDTDLPSSVLDEMTYTQSADTLFLAGAFFPRKLVRTADDAWTISKQSFVPFGTAPIDITTAVTGMVATDRQVLYRVAAVDGDRVESLPSEEVIAELDLNWPTAGRVDIAWNSIVDGIKFQWTVSTSGTSEYYCELSGGGDPSIPEPETVYADKLELLEDTLGSLSVSEWAYGDNDSLGFNTIYVRLADNTDPDTKAAGFVTHKLSTDVQWRVYKNYRGDWGWIGDVDKPFLLDDNIEPAVGTSYKEDDTKFVDGDADTYPYAVGIFKQRLHYARTNDNPQTVYSSVLGDLTNYSISRPLSSEDSIRVTLQSGSRVDEIRHLTPLDRLVVNTTGSEWIYDQGSNSDALTPFNVNFRNQGYSGVRTSVQPLGIDNELLFVQRDGKDVRSMRFRLEDENYLGEVLTYFVPHLFEGRTIVDWCYQQHPNNLVWIVLSDGAMLSMTYIPEQQMVAFTRHDTVGKFEACASITSQGEDLVHFIVRRTINGSVVRYLEKFATRSFTNVRDAKFLDSSLSYAPSVTISNVVATATEVTVTAAAHGYSNGDHCLIDDVVGITSTGANSDYSVFNDKKYKVANALTNSFELEGLGGETLTTTDFTGTYVEGGLCRKCTLTVSGLDHLEAETVGVLADGQYMGTSVVASGSITLADDSGVGFSTIIIGEPYTSRLETLRLETISTNDTLQGKQLNIKRLKLRVKDTGSGITAGPAGADASDNERLTIVKWRQYEEWRQPNALKTEDVEHIMRGSWNNTGRFVIEQAEPLPLTILMLIIEFEAGGV